MGKRNSLNTLSFTYRDIFCPSGDRLADCARVFSNDLSRQFC